MGTSVSETAKRRQAAGDGGESLQRRATREEEPRGRDDARQEEEGAREGEPPRRAAAVAPRLPDRGGEEGERQAGEPGHDVTECPGRPAVGERESRECRAAAEEERRERAEDSAVGLREASPQNRDEGDQGGGDEDRRRPEPEDARDAPARHAAVAAFDLFSALKAFFVMNRSVCSCASSSTICTGGDFIR